jgi:transcriptional regulator with XRE-family HTH domain
MTGPDLKNIRQGLGYGQPDFARLLGMFGESRGSKLSDMEREERPIPWKTAQLAFCYFAIGDKSEINGIADVNKP